MIPRVATGIDAGAEARLESRVSKAFDDKRVGSLARSELSLNAAASLMDRRIDRLGLDDISLRDEN